MGNLRTPFEEPTAAFEASAAAGQAGEQLQSLARQLDRTGEMIESIRKGNGSSKDQGNNPAKPASELRMRANDTGSQTIRVDQEKLDRLLPLALQYNAKLIGLTISSKGIPQNKDQRLELAAFIVAA